MKIVEALGIYSGVYSKLMQRLLQSEGSLKDFHNGLINATSAKAFAKKRAGSFSTEQRRVLVGAIKNQYKNSSKTKEVVANIKRLGESNAVSITTGHQLNIFTGPLFFWYKILDAINTAEKLQAADATHHYVPVFWMASEDHDIEEINHFFLRDQKVRWDAPKGGPVGRIRTEKVEQLYNELALVWGDNPSGKELLELFASCYLKEKNLADATRELVHQLFGKYGLVIVDGDDPALKSLFRPIATKELISQTTFTAVSQTNKALAKEIKNYTPQVNPREINLFYLLDEERTRIIKNNSGFATADFMYSWTKSDILDEIEQHPARFSPNALMRPLYQECVLPNIAYVGGGGELAYWLQLKSTFEDFDISYPLLQHRSSMLLMSSKQVKKCLKLELPLQDLFLPKASFINKRVRQISDIDIDFSAQRKLLKQQFETLHHLAEQTDKSFLGAVNAQEKKQLNGLNALEKRLLKAQRIKLQDEILRITDIQNALFPAGKLQERLAHFSDFLDVYSIETFTKELKETLAESAYGLNVIEY